jgi:hypothetical protein
MALVIAEKPGLSGPDPRPVTRDIHHYGSPLVDNASHLPGSVVFAGSGAGPLGGGVPRSRGCRVVSVVVGSRTPPLVVRRTLK